MTPDILEELKQLRWVEEAELVPDEEEIVITSKEKSLKTTLTHAIRKGDGRYDPQYISGNKLSEPIPLLLPQYKIYLSTSAFRYAFNNRPKTRRNIGIVPTYERTYPTGQWKVPTIPCYGDTWRQTSTTSLLGDYRNAQNWKERAIIAAVFLQSAEPHYGETWYRTAYAYRLRLVGDEMLEKKTDN